MVFQSFLLRTLMFVFMYSLTVSAFLVVVYTVTPAIDGSILPSHRVKIVGWVPEMGES